MRRPLFPIALSGLLLLFAAPAPAWAQDGSVPRGREAGQVEDDEAGSSEDAVDEDGQVPPEPRGIWPVIRGTPEPNRLYVGKAAFHLERMHDGLSWHPKVGVSWRGFFVKTFINTHELRTWAVGIGRGVLTAEGEDYGLRFGYRLGLVRGYDERLMRQAADWPVLPGGQIVLDARVRGMGVQLAWVWIVTSATAFVEFD